MSGANLSEDLVRHIIAEVMHPSHFIVRPPLEVDWQHAASETVAWEIFRGRLVPGNQTRETRVFESWHCFGTDEFGHSNEPLLSVKFDSDRCELHVVRGLLCYVWEGYDSGGGVYLSRETQGWVRELVGTIRVDAAQTKEQLRTELSSLLFHAVIGISRLPLTSLEAPMPAWSLGRLAYFPGEAQEPLPQATGFLHALSVATLAPTALEFMLRSSSFDELPDAVDQFLVNWSKLGKSAKDSGRLLRALFNEVSLSPYTDFVDKTLRFVQLLVERRHWEAEHQIDFLGWLLHQLARHLTAYDLVKFHHTGANYPDALLLDAALKEYLRLVEGAPALFVGDDQRALVRRRALRLGWLHRRRYEGHLVTDSPTSLGENSRILPPPHVHVPEQQIVNPTKRNKLLFDGDPLPKHVGAHGLCILKECSQDLKKDGELRELGMAIFIERPLGAGLMPGEPDTSPLLAHEAYSLSLAKRALLELAREPLLEMKEIDIKLCKQMLDETQPSNGIKATSLVANAARVVSLADAAKATTDFVILRTLPGSVKAFAEYEPVAKILAEEKIEFDPRCNWLIVAGHTPVGQPCVSITNAAGHEEFQIELDRILAR